ncbi:MAG: BlaI/MecI/CopY family transcriptional regulator [Bacteroidetes bacterium]|nr:BlaI/MecI/CopY family transcriptional regulator [Bacteroidota bacterium]
MKELTKAEEQVMQIVWTIEKGFLKDILDGFPSPKPASTTVSTVIKILENKKMIAHNTFGKIHQYYPLVSKEAYREKVFGSMLSNYFNNSMDNLVSFFVQKRNIDISELDALIKQIKKNKK